MKLIVTTFFTVGTGVGDVFSLVSPLDFVTLLLHQPFEMAFGFCKLHTGIDRHSQIKFPALTFIKHAVLAVGDVLLLFIRAGNTDA